MSHAIDHAKILSAICDARKSLVTAAGVATLGKIEEAAIAIAENEQHIAIAKELIAQIRGSQPTNNLPWRCFHCDEVFMNGDEARLHFGNSLDALPVCQVDAAKLRELEQQLRDKEDQLRSYREEDTELHQQIRSIESQHDTAIRRAEESGYAKGLRDGKLLYGDWVAVARVTPNPDENTTVLCCEHIHYLTCREGAWTDLYFGDGKWASGRTPKYWTPLPSPPKSDEAKTSPIVSSAIVDSSSPPVEHCSTCDGYGYVPGFNGISRDCMRCGGKRTR